MLDGVDAELWEKGNIRIREGGEGGEGKREVKTKAV
jgi:hypothetical protein